MIQPQYYFIKDHKKQFVIIIRKIRNNDSRRRQIFLCTL